jgi:MFS family permease
MRRGEADFVRLWTGQTLSGLGSQVTVLALPLTAAVLLDATALQMGLLTAAQWLPGLLFGLIAGVWADRLPRRRLMLAADLARAVIVAVIPLAWLAGALRLEVVYVVALLASGVGVFFDAAALALLPLLVERDRLASAGSRMHASRSLAQTIGPWLAGGLVQVLGAPLAMGLDALSFVASAISLVLLRVHEAPRPDTRAPWVADIRETVALILADPILRPVALASAAFNLAAISRQTVFILFVTRELGLGPAVLGASLAVGGASGVLGAVVAARVANWLGFGPTMLGGLLLVSLGFAAAPLATFHLDHRVPIVVLGEALIGLGVALANVPFGVLIQASVPAAILGRVWATVRVMCDSVIPIGALLGGTLGELIGTGPTQLVSAVGCALAVTWMATSPVRLLHGLPAAHER